MSDYQNFDHAAWMQKEIDNQHANKRSGHTKLPKKLNEFQKRVFNILGIMANGIYNARLQFKTINFEYGSGMSVNWNDELSSFDNDTLTKLVFLCHEARIRCTIIGTGPGRTRLIFTPRKSSGSNIGVRHPNLIEAVGDFKTWFNPKHQINYRESDDESDTKTEVTVHSQGKTGTEG